MPRNSLPSNARSYPRASRHAARKTEEPGISSCPCDCAHQGGRGTVPKLIVVWWDRRRSVPVRLSDRLPRERAGGSRRI